MEGCDNDIDLSLATEGSATDDFDVDAILNSKASDPVTKQTFKSKNDKLISSSSSSSSSVNMNMNMNMNMNVNNKSLLDANDDYHDSNISPKNNKKTTGGKYSLIHNFNIISPHMKYFLLSI